MQCRNCRFVNPDPTKLKCPKCGTYNHTLAVHTSDGTDGTVLLSDSKVSHVERTITGLVDETFGGGIALTSVTLLAGEPGAGKTTLCLQLADIYAEQYQREVLYIANEQDPSELKSTGERLQLKNLNLIRVVKAMGGLESNLTDICTRYKPSLLILDSVTNWAGEDLHAAVTIAKQIKSLTVDFKCPSILINQVTKGGDHAGLNQLQHAVDATCLFKLVLEEGEEATPETPRQLTMRKNRNGPAPVEQFFTMGPFGLVPCDSPFDSDDCY